MKRMWFPLSAALCVGGVMLAEDAAKPAPESPEQVFQQLDKDGDGVIGRDEVGSERERFFDRMIRVSDENGDGKLSKEEFLAGSKERPVVQQSAEGRRGPGEGRPDPGRFFDFADRNQDGKVTLDELPEQAKRRLAPMFERLGKDELTRDDFANFAAMREEGGREGAGDRRRPEGDRPRGEGDRPRGEGDRPRGEGDRPRGPRDGEGDRPRGPRDGEGPRPPFGREGGGPPLFRQLDKNGDGKLSRDEFESIARMFDEMDRNKDGMVDPPELFGMGPRGPEGRPPFGGPMREGDRPRGEGDRPGREGDRPRGEGDRPRPEGDRPRGEGDRPEGRFGGRNVGPEQMAEFVIGRMDKNDDGKLSRDEMPERMRDGFAEMDENEDGFVDKAEFAARAGFGRRGPGGEGRPGFGPPRGEGRPEGGFGGRPGPGGPDGFLNAFFERFDTDKDGKVTKDEMPERMRERLGEIDKNKDGAVDKEEMRSMAPPGGPRRGEGGRGGRPGDRERREEGDKRADDV